MGPFAHCRANRVRTAPNPLQGGAFHQRPQRLLIQAYRHSDARPLPHRRTPRARSRQLSQVIPALGLISPRLNLLISHRNSAKKTITHSEYRIRNSLVAPRLPCHHCHRRQHPSPTPTRPCQRKGRRCALCTPPPRARGRGCFRGLIGRVWTPPPRGRGRARALVRGPVSSQPESVSRNPSARIRQSASVSRSPSG